MKRIARLISYIVVCLFFLTIGFVAQPFLYFLGEDKRIAFISKASRLWARALLQILSIRVALNGQGLQNGKPGCLLAGNHLSYIDIIIIISVLPSVFVAKSDVSEWPILGWMAQLGRSVFIVREDPVSNVIGVYRTSRRLRDGYAITFFPEGTTGDGSVLLPFKALYFASAIRAQVDILPFTINYKVINGSRFNSQNRDLVCWYGDMEFGEHFWNLLEMRNAEVEVTVHNPIPAKRGSNAREISAQIRGIIEQTYEGFVQEEVSSGD